MVFFIVVLRALSACLITNAHYTGIYPTDLIANGGLIGDILFFAISGYCLFNVKKSFPSWYGKRLYRIYPPVILITAIYFLIGSYSFARGGVLWWFVYPTYYHFVASILLLYIPFYIVAKVKALRDRVPLVMSVVAVAYIIVYVIFYDKSYYHIDNVREWMIRFLFFESMLLGAYFKKNQEKFQNKFRWYVPVIALALFVAYFVSKLFFVKYTQYSSLQIANQIIIFALLYFVFWLFASIDEKLVKIPKWIKAPITFISKITLEIYVVQYVIIDLIRPLLSFPLNWLAITSSIIISAYILHILCELFYKAIDLVIGKIKKSKNSNKKEEKIA